MRQLISGPITRRSIASWPTRSFAPPTTLIAICCTAQHLSAFCHASDVIPIGCVRELNTALEVKASQFEASNRELESFTYSVSHDLRAPLRAIDGFALMLEEDYEGRLDGEGLRYLSVIRENSRRMGLLIDDLLSFSRLGRQAVKLGEVNIDALVREVVEEVSEIFIEFDSVRKKYPALG